MKINTISPQDNKYLQIITSIAISPNKLYFIGMLPKERRPTVAIVGSRRPTTYGKEVTHNLAYDLAKRGVVIISGLALGVDGIAHRAALDAGGTTLAVLANGLDTIYPASHRDLAASIVAQGGAIISEYEPTIEARGFQF
ncbi:MAG TPA: DNA-processing protein DprA, partial [Candidatus Saccharimonadales bacterium]|nr:DNA-processing protein DprA [Candidatus Saccharimonadales bacterium]